MALSIHRLNPRSFQDTDHHPGSVGVAAGTVPFRYYSSSLEVGRPSGQASSMAIHADLQNRYDHVVERAPPSREQHAVSSHTTSSTSRSLPNTQCEVPSASLPPRPSLQRQEFHTFTTPERPFESCRTAPKRRRAIHDVDGPHTATLGCKKRRLRRDLITSRLSRPFSSPATHILNREAAAGGKRFLKMAAAAAARKVTAVVIPTPPSTGWDLGAKVAAAQVATVIPANNIHALASAEMIRRAAILNRFRLRVCEEARQRGERTDLEMTASTALLRAGTGLHGVGFLADPRMSQGLAPSKSRQNPQWQQSISTSSMSRATASVSRATVPLTITRPADPQPPSPTHTAACSSPPGTPLKAMRRLDLDYPSPRPRPLTPSELPAVQSHGIEPAGNDDQLSFSATDYSDDFADPDDSDIYTDFSVIFGGGYAEEAGADNDRGSVEENSGASEHFEDYMDDLDGIPWDAR